MWAWSGFTNTQPGRHLSTRPSVGSVRQPIRNRQVATELPISMIESKRAGDRACLETTGAIKTEPDRKRILHQRNHNRCMKFQSGVGWSIRTVTQRRWGESFTKRIRLIDTADWHIIIASPKMQGTTQRHRTAQRWKDFGQPVAERWWLLRYWFDQGKTSAANSSRPGSSRPITAKRSRLSLAHAICEYRQRQQRNGAYPIIFPHQLEVPILAGMPPRMHHYWHRKTSPADLLIIDLLLNPCYMSNRKWHPTTPQTTAQCLSLWFLR